MDNKYEAFLEAVDKLKSEKMKKECRIMIKLAQRYYSKYDQYKRMWPLKRYLSKSYAVEHKKINVNIPKADQLTPINQLYVEFYLKIIRHEEFGGRKKYVMIEGYECEICDMQEQLKGISIPERLRGEKFYADWSDEECLKLVNRTFKLMKESCKKVCEKYKATRVMDLKPGSAQEELKSYREIPVYIEYPEEVSFNAVFSESYIELLIKVMGTLEGTLPLFLAPVRAQLCYHGEGGREMDNKVWKKCFEKDFRLKLDDIDEQIENIAESYQKLAGRFKVHKNKLYRFLRAGIISY